MNLKAKILPEYLDLILEGKKRFEMRSLEFITLSDGKREHTFEIKSASIEGGEWLWECFPNFLRYGHPVLIIEIGVEQKQGATGK